MPKRIVAGNWKMHTCRTQAMALASEIRDIAADELSDTTTLVVCPPFIHLPVLQRLLEGQTRIQLGAQNCHTDTQGAFTGEVSAEMLPDYGVSYLILGHSERRLYAHETDQQLTQKVQQALAAGLQVIFCCGEPLEVRQVEEHLDYVVGQVQEALFGFSAKDFEQITLAYEPIWAIGTGQTATAEQAQQMHQHLRQALAQHYGNQTAQTTSILYGGSCKPANAAELLAQPDIDGGLIGGASLNARDFIEIAKAFPHP